MGSIRVESNGSIEAFSRGKLAESLRACGARPAFAKSIAELIYCTIALSLYDSIISTQEIKRRTHALLIKKNPHVAEKYAKNEERKARKK